MHAQHPSTDFGSPQREEEEGPGKRKREKERPKVFERVGQGERVVEAFIQPVGTRPRPCPSYSASSYFASFSVALLCVARSEAYTRRNNILCQLETVQAPTRRDSDLSEGFLICHPAFVVGGNHHQDHPRVWPWRWVRFFTHSTRLLCSNAIHYAWRNIFGLNSRWQSFDSEVWNTFFLFVHLFLPEERPTSMS